MFISIMMRIVLLITLVSSVSLCGEDFYFNDNHGVAFNLKVPDGFEVPEYYKDKSRDYIVLGLQDAKDGVIMGINLLYGISEESISEKASSTSLVSRQLIHGYTVHDQSMITIGEWSGKNINMTKNVNGIFLDENIKHLRHGFYLLSIWTSFDKKIAEERRAAVLNAQKEMIESLKIISPLITKENNNVTSVKLQLPSQIWSFHLGLQVEDIAVDRRLEEAIWITMKDLRLGSNAGVFESAAIAAEKYEKMSSETATRTKLYNDDSSNKNFINKKINGWTVSVYNTLFGKKERAGFEIIGVNGNVVCAITLSSKDLTIKKENMKDMDILWNFISSLKIDPYSE